MAVEILQRRADLIVTGLREMFSLGVNPKDIIQIENDDAPYPQLHRDMLMVYLGIKPLASHLIPVTEAYWKSGVFDCFEKLPSGLENGVDVLYDEVGVCVWNPNQVREVLRKFGYNNKVNVRNTSEFPDFLTEIIINPSSPEQEQLAGEIHGYPSQAAELFSKHAREIFHLGPILWENAIAHGIEVITEPPNQP